jgi:thiamine biosynthesis lipoprotein ApbE
LIQSAAAAISGDFLFSSGQNFDVQKIRDPRSGVSPTELSKVTVLAPPPTQADGLIITMMVVGLEEGWRLIEHLHSVEAILETKIMTIHTISSFPTTLVRKTN